MDINTIKDPVCYYLGQACTVLAMNNEGLKPYKAWAIVAAGVAGWAVGVFVATRTLLPKPAAMAVIGICTYAGARMISDIFNLFSMCSIWLLNAERGGRYQQRVVLIAAQV